MTHPLRYRVSTLPGFVMERWPVAVDPRNDELVLVDRGVALRADKYVPAFFRDGEWYGANRRPLNFQPTFWTRMVDG